ncbi:hypothetical protein ACFFRR_005926 [Megaselia abdita]
MFKIGFLFPCIIFVNICIQDLSGFSNRQSDWSFRGDRGYRGFDLQTKNNVVGDFVFPNSNQIVFPNPKEKDLEAQGTSWFQKIKSKWNDLTKENYRKSDKKYFEYTSIVFPEDYSDNKIDVSEEAQEQDYNGRVLADPGEYPHMAAIGFQAPGQDQPSFRCGGSLISKIFVITAAHCTEFKGDEPNFVILGDVDLTRTESDMSDQRFQIKRIINHPEYNKSSYYFDIALLELNRVIEFTEFVRPIRLWAHEDIPYDTAYAMGYGSTEFGGRQTNKLTDLNLTIVANDQCNTMMPKSSETENGITSHQICAIDYHMNRDTCQVSY